MSSIAVLFAAIEANDLPALNAALEAGVSPDARDEMGRPALLVAANAGHEAMAAALLQHGADVNAYLTIDFGMGLPVRDTALTRATSTKHRAVVALLLAHGALDNDALDARDGVKFGSPARNERLPLDKRLECALWDADLAYVTRLLEAGASPRGATVHGEPLLMAALRLKRPGHVEALLAHGADPNQMENDKSALEQAAAAGNLEGMKALLRHGAKVHDAAAIVNSVYRLRDEIAALLAEHGFPTT